MKKLMICTGILLFFSMIFLSCSKDEQQNKILTSNRKASLEKAADSVFMAHSTPGMIALISVEGEGDYIIKRGVSNIATGEPMNENNYFRIASNTKTFTGTAILILVDEGKIDLNKPISFYLPKYNIPNGDIITIRMLGNMTSGLYDYTSDQDLWNSYIASNYTKSFTPDSLLAYAFRHPVKFSPGKVYDYCNTNIVLLGLLMEKITGKSAQVVIEEKVIKPLNLELTFWPTSVFLPSHYTHGYIFMPGIIEATNWNPSWGYTAGGLISTFSDMKIWAKALAEGKLLSEKMKSERFTWVDNHYGFCVMKAGNWIGHAGSIFGYNSHIFYNPVKKITLIVLTNMNDGLPVEYFTPAFVGILEK
jgi:D-alanyl-D-alanine carboxypeptidase